ncbi:hypothetical protein ACIHAA_25785 [Streptomyces sp. NPDC052040]|uniref:hypothetical protein n=1 Tax=Streptomyces sp. NPDC052040 TaxID=3365682 RepID=UPI0037D46B2C
MSVLNGYVSYSREGCRIDVPASALTKVPQAEVDKLNTYIDAVNDDIRSGTLVMSGDGVAVTASSEEHVPSAFAADEPAVQSATLASLLGGGHVAAVVAAALGTAAGAIQVCQHKDGWTILYWLGSIAPYAFVCNPFG